MEARYNKFTYSTRRQRPAVTRAASRGRASRSRSPASGRMSDHHDKATMSSLPRCESPVRVPSPAVDYPVRDVPPRAYSPSPRRALDAQLPSPPSYDKYSYPLQRQHPSGLGSPQRTRESRSPSCPAPPVSAPPPRRYPDPLVLGRPGPLIPTWPLSSAPDPQQPQAKEYNSFDYASKRCHPAGMGFNKAEAEANQRERSRSPATEMKKSTASPPLVSTSTPLTGPNVAWDHFTKLAAGNGIDPADIGLLFWDTVEQLCIHFGMLDPLDIAAVQSEWRVRHAGDDSPPPILPPAPLPLPIDLLPIHDVPASPPHHVDPFLATRATESHTPRPVKAKQGPKGKLDWMARPRVDTGRKNSILTSPTRLRPTQTA